MICLPKFLPAIMPMNAADLFIAMFRASLKL